MKIIIPIEVDISKHDYTKKWTRKCPTLNLGVGISGWEMSSWRDDTLEESIIAISNQIKNKLTSEWLAMKIYNEFKKRELENLTGD